MLKNTLMIALLSTALGGCSPDPETTKVEVAPPPAPPPEIVAEVPDGGVVIQTGIIRDEKKKCEYVYVVAPTGVAIFMRTEPFGPGSRQVCERKEPAGLIKK